MMFGLACIVLVYCQVTPLNGPLFSRWTWNTEIPLGRVVYYLSIPFMVYCLALYLIDKTERSKLVVGLLTLTNLLTQISAISITRHSFKWIYYVVDSPTTTSYYTDALSINNLLDWLTNYHLLNTLHMHSMTHPPGPILLYYLFNKFLGPYYGAYAGALTIGLLGSISIIILYQITTIYDLKENERLTVCAYYSIIPSLILFFPEFDQMYTIFSMTMVYFWLKSLNIGITYIFPFTLIVFISTMFAYNILAVGIFIVLFALHYIYYNTDRSGAIKYVLKLAITFGIGIILMYAILYALTGYNPVYSFLSALVNQHYIQSIFLKGERAYYITIFTDIYDFFLGSGFLSLPLLILFVRNTWLKGGAEYKLSYVWIGLISILIINLTGLLRCETARVWLFLQPFLAISVVIELNKFSSFQKNAILIVLFLILVTIKSSMWFVSP